VCSSKPRQRGSTEQHKADAPACTITVFVVSGQKTKIGVSLRNSKSHQVTNSVIFSCNNPFKIKTASFTNWSAPNKKKSVGQSTFKDVHVNGCHETRQCRRSCVLIPKKQSHAQPFHDLKVFTQKEDAPVYFLASCF
jgi:hypothetical protein